MSSTDKRDPLKDAARLCVAPMMDRTDRHFRYLLRQITRRTLLYSEMVTTHALLHGDVDWLLGHDPVERPLALQLGGDDPRALAECAKLGEGAGYGEIDLNVGCPSDRVQKGRFGACLMARPQLVAECVAAMMAEVAVPITVKHRIGVDDQDSFEQLERFVSVVAEAGCPRFVVHARKALLAGLTPKQNRSVPPLRYDLVYRLKERFPELSIVLNGGIASVQQAAAHLQEVDGAMIGRAACDDPFVLADADEVVFGEAPSDITRHQVAQAMLGYMERYRHEERAIAHIARHMLNLFAGQPGARQWRRNLSASGPVTVQGVRAALGALRDACDDAPVADILAP